RRLRRQADPRTQGRHQAAPAVGRRVPAVLIGHVALRRHVGREADFADLATEVGLDRESVLAALRSGEHRDAVDADIRQARAYGITGVPFFVINGKYGVSGAQEPAVFEDALRRAADDTQEVSR